MRSASAARPTCSSAARAGSRSPRSRAAGRQKRKLCPAWAWTASATLSRALNSGKMLVIWNERAIPRSERAGAASRVTSSPAKRMRPASALSSPESCAMSVVLPAPLGPMSASVSLSATSRSTPSVATSPPNRLQSPRTASSGSAIARGGARQQPVEPAPGVEDDEDQQRSQDDLPVHRPRRQHVLEQQVGGGAEHGADERPHAAEDDHHHDLAR